MPLFPLSGWVETGQNVFSPWTVKKILAAPGR
jgi:hypothetical protein